MVSRDVSARSMTGKRKHGLGWVPWLALLLLIAIAVATVLIVLNVSDENDQPGVDLQDDEGAAALVMAVTETQALGAKHGRYDQ